MYEYVNTEFPDTRMMMIKNKDKYTVLYTENDLLYLFRTTGEVSIIEAKHIAKKLNKGIEEYSLR